MKPPDFSFADAFLAIRTGAPEAKARFDAAVAAIEATSPRRTFSGGSFTISPPGRPTHTLDPRYVRQFFDAGWGRGPGMFGGGGDGLP